MKTGDVVADRFEIEGLAGSGGMGRVYRALDRALGGTVALKVMDARAPSERFEREAEVLARLHHPHIVRYVAHGFSRSGHYLAMEWLDGEDLAARLARGVLQPEETLLVAKQAAEALGAAHAEGVVHRDVKPGNLVLVGGSSSDVRLVDFGLAAVVHVPRRGALTQAGAILGTPAYMAPEQVRCEARIDARADVYSLGCVLFECLTARCPFEGPNAIATFAKILVDDAPRVSEFVRSIPEGLDDLIADMLQKARDERPAHGRAVVERVAPLCAVDVRRLVPSRPPSLTRDEQRLASVVVLGGVLSGPSPTSARTPGGQVGTEHGARDEGLARAATLLDLPAVTAPPPVDTDVAELDPDARLEAVRALSARFGGDVEPLPDGSVIIVHDTREGAPEPASRAARTALALRAAFPDVRIGLSTGRSTTTRQGRTIGEVLDRASALLAEEGEGRAIRIDEVSRGLLEARFEIGGDAQAAHLLGERGAARAERTLLGRQTACVGRERELTDLLSLLGETIAQGRSRAVWVSAAPGVGKSRLRYELLRRVGATFPGAAIWVGWADPLGAGSSFGLLAPLVRRVVGISDEDAPDARRAKLSTRVEARVPGADGARVAEFLGELVGAHFEDETRVQLRAARSDAVLLGDQMARAFGDFVVGEASRRPVVMVLEDVHWGDEPSLRFIDGALARAKDLPLFVLALGRPEAESRFEAWVAKRAWARVALGELDEAASRALVEHALGGADDALVRKLVERAAGNAFYLEELIRAVADGRGVSLPGTVLAVAQARLEGLSHAERRLLRAASIFGASFTTSGVVALLGRDADRDVASRLAALVEREILVSVGEGRGGGDGRFAFRHALLRDAAYAMLTPEDCALGHRLAGEFLCDAGGADALVLAEHFERGLAKARAGAWYRRGAEQALEANDFPGALARATSALACGLAGEDAGHVQLVAAEASRWSRDHAAAEQHASAALKLLAPGSLAWFAAAGEAALALGRLGRFAELEAVARDLAASAHASPSPTVVAALARASDQLLFAGEHRLYRALVETLESLVARRPPDPVVETWRTYVRAGAAMMVDSGEYVVQMRALVAGFEDLGDARNACLQRVNLADAYIHVGHYAEAALLAREAFAEGVALGLRLTAGSARYNLARALGELGELAEARTLAAETVAEMHAARDHRIEAAASGALSRILLRAGALVEAEAAARSGLSLQGVPPPVRSLVLGHLTFALLAQGRASEARVAAEAAFEILSELGALDEGEVFVRLARAEALLADGRAEEGRRALLAARDRLVAKASTMSSAHWRSLFLSSVEENRRTLELAERFSG